MRRQSRLMDAGGRVGLGLSEVHGLHFKRCSKRSRYDNRLAGTNVLMALGALALARGSDREAVVRVGLGADSTRGDWHDRPREKVETWEGKHDAGERETEERRGIALERGGCGVDAARDARPHPRVKSDRT